MKPIFKSTKTIAAAAAVGLFAIGSLTLPGSASAQVINTRHNLSTVTGASTPASRNTITGDSTGQICVYCHTPHGAESSGKAPLWNRTISTSGYTMYSNTGKEDSLTGGIASQPSGSSIACLSCHDGTQALNTIFNAPGSGGYNGTATAFGTVVARTDVTGGITSGALSANTAPNLGTNLQNDHPIGIQYCGGGLLGGGATSASGACVDPDFTSASSGTINGATAYWVDTGTSPGTRDKGDLILYTQTVGTLGSVPTVECATCHDPHSANTLFLRVSSNGSLICRSCHVK